MIFLDSDLPAIKNHGFWIASRFWESNEKIMGKHEKHGDVSLLFFVILY
jgi:hypothetical protein